MSRPPFFLLRFSFLTKVCLFLMIFIFVITVVFTGLFIHYQRGMLNQVLIRNGGVLCRIIAQNARLAVLSESDDLLKDVIDSAFGQDEVIQIMIYNDRGDLLTWQDRSRYAASVGEPESRIMKTVAARAGAASGIYIREKADVVEFWSPVAPAAPYQTEESLFLEAGRATPASASSAAVSGWIGICVDKTKLKREFRNLVWKSGLVGLAFWVLGSILSFIAVRRFTRPLKQLKAGVTALESGGPVDPIVDNRRDELGELARAFNRMAGTIQAKEAALTASEAKYRSIVENAAEGIFQIDPKGRILMANPALASMLGYGSPQAMIREGVDFLTHVKVEEDQRNRFREQFQKDDYAVAVETVCRRADGGSVPVMVNVHVVRDLDGNAILYEGLMQDITPWKRAERLKMDKEAAEASALAKSRFLANMSHEIRTPLGAVTGMITVMRRSPDLSLDQKSQLHKIHASAQTLLGIIGDILDFSQIEAGKLRLEKAPFAWDPMARQLAHLFSGKAMEKGIDLVFDFSRDFPSVLVGSALRLKQVLINLIGNALKFTPEGGRIAVTGHVLERKEDGGILLEFKVADTGIGIPQSRLSDIFESFTQCDDSTSRKYGGAGLGLAISKQLVEMMGGRIQLVSGEKMGSTFSFTVFMEEGDVLPAEAGNGEEHLAEELAGARILVAEDHPINQEVVRKLLEAEGVRVFMVENGREALAAMEGMGVDLVLMDIQMPEMDGYEAARRIRMIRPDPADPPIIAMTAHALPEEREKCLAAGMVDVVIKPLDLSQLFGALNRWLPRGEAKRAPRKKKAPEVPEREGGATLPFPADLPGIDVADARKRFMGNRRFLARLLRQMVDEYGDAADQFRSHLAAGRREEARMLAHTLKGVAGNCSARTLFRIVSNLESGLREEEKPPAPADFDDLENAIVEVAAAVDRLDAESPEPVAPAAADRPVTPEEMVQRFRTLDLLLTRHDIQAERSFRRLAAGLRDRACAEPLRTLDRQIRGFRFKQARETLETLAQMAGVALRPDGPETQGGEGDEA